jgi:hypothetical protein
MQSHNKDNFERVANENKRLQEKINDLEEKNYHQIEDIKLLEQLNFVKA